MSNADQAITRLALTPGEPAGIGPDLAVLAAQQSREFELVAFTDPDLLRARAKELNLPLTLREYQAGKALADDAGTLCIYPVQTTEAVQTGELNPANAGYVLNTLGMAVDACLDHQMHALVTGPVHKGVINDSGIAFTGHTEFIAERSSSYPVMMLLAGELRVALATTHIPLAEVACAITRERLLKVCRVLHTDLQETFAIDKPHILVAGLNPHAGESGHLGLEEINVIEPVLEELRSEGMQLTGPLPADTLFTPQHLDNADAVLAMYHDQGLPVLKYAGFGEAVNITLGLPLIRTSVDHGTALDLAGSGNINSGSLNAATQLALRLAGNRLSGPGPRVQAS